MITRASVWILAVVSLFAFSTACLADDGINLQNSGSTRIQIERPKEPLKANASMDRDLGALNNDDAARLRAAFAQQADGSKPTKLRANAAQDDMNFRGQTPMLDRMFKGQAAAQGQGFFKMRAQDQGNQGGDNAPYVWCQSTQGGYYDCTNTYRGVVPGYRLKELGGRFADGTLVPRGNVKMNEAGHVWWQSDLSRNFKHY